jgi:hypothetical protein
MTTARARKGHDTGVSWEQALQEARSMTERLPEVLHADVYAAIELAEEKFPKDPTPDEIDAAVLDLQDSLPWTIEEVLEGSTPQDRRTADCIQLLAAEVLELRARVATLEEALS